jgi:hypothetical protein
MQLRHGLKRGVYVVPLAKNYDKFLKGEEKFLSKGIQETQEETTRFVKDRWIIPRSERDAQWKYVDGGTSLRSAINSALTREVL